MGMGMGVERRIGRGTREGRCAWRQISATDSTSSPRLPFSLSFTRAAEAGAGRVWKGKASGRGEMGTADGVGLIRTWEEEVSAQLKVPSFFPQSQAGIY